MSDLILLCLRYYVWNRDDDVTTHRVVVKIQYKEIYVNNLEGFMCKQFMKMHNNS